MGIRERSGKINSNSRLVSFLYTLIRDDIVCGRIESIVKEIESCEATTFQFSNGWLALHAKDLAERLQLED